MSKQRGLVAGLLPAILAAAMPQGFHYGEMGTSDHEYPVKGRPKARNRTPKPDSYLRRMQQGKS